MNVYGEEQVVIIAPYTGAKWELLERGGAFQLLSQENCRRYITGGSIKNRAPVYEKIQLIHDNCMKKMPHPGIATVFGCGFCMFIGVGKYP